jgi:zinc transporter ZupT
MFLFRHVGQAVIAATMAVAAGAILAVIVGTMLPESSKKRTNTQAS